MIRLRSTQSIDKPKITKERTAIVENSRLFGLLFLFSNLHVLHHRQPGISWYRLPAMYPHDREMLIRSDGGLVYDSYWDIARQFLLRPHDDPTHSRHS